MDIYEIYGYEQPLLERCFADFYNKFARDIDTDENFSLSDDEVTEVFDELVLRYMKQTMSRSEWDRVISELQ